MDKLDNITTEVPPTGFSTQNNEPVNINNIIASILSTFTTEQVEMYKLGEVKRGKRQLSNLDLLREGLYREIEGLSLTKKIEDENNYKELIDWTRIAQLGFVSENAKEVTEKNYTNIITERSKIIHDELNGLNEGEAALFIISSGSHKFPDDMEIFNVIPPSLDKMNRWITENQNNLQQKNEKEVQNEGEQDKQSGLWTP